MEANVLLSKLFGSHWRASLAKAFEVKQRRGEEVRGEERGGVKR
jgi:hypothetical protein